MDRWEYRCIAIIGGGYATERRLNEFGRDGWELVATWGFWHYLKRRLESSTWNRD